VLALLLASPAWAYGEVVHVEVTHAAIDGYLPAIVPDAVEPGAVARLRARIDTFARNHPVHGTEWQRRHATPERFDNFALKELLLYSPEARVVGIDDSKIGGEDLADIAALASRSPDDDFRNRDRLAHDADRKPLDGVPADPAILNMGKLGALSSQAHAHYGLPPLEFSSDPSVLQSDPRRFAVASGYPAGPVLTLAPEMAQALLDLSMLAWLDGQARLAAAYQGQAFHYLADVANPVHTVQVGLYDFFKDAFFGRLWLSAMTGGGYLGELRSLPSLGIDILSSHHTLGEQITQVRLLNTTSPQSSQLRSAIASTDAPLQSDLDKIPTEGEWGAAITRALVERGSHDGAALYGATRAIAVSRLRRPGVLFDDAHDNPEDFVVTETARNAKSWFAFWELQQTSFRRAGTALRNWAERYADWSRDVARDPALAEAARTEALERLVGRQLRMLGEAEARLADYRAHPPGSTTRPERMPGMLAAEVGLVAVVLGAIAWVRRQKSTA
jgi:hypothetical protein